MLSVTEISAYLIIIIIIIIIELHYVTEAEPITVVNVKPQYGDGFNYFEGLTLQSANLICSYILFNFTFALTLSKLETTG